VLLKVPGGRVYCFYNYNRDNIREVIADDPPFAGDRQQSCDGKTIVGLLSVWSEISPGRKGWLLHVSTMPSGPPPQDDR